MKKAPQKAPLVPTDLFLSADVSFRLSSVTPFADALPSSLAIWSIGAKVGLRLPPEWISDVILHAGVAFSRETINQTSALVPTVGNMTGSRMAILSPFVRATWDKLYAGEIQIDWNGSYNLSRPQIDGGNISYGSPFGLKFTGEYCVGSFFDLPGLFAGGTVSTLSFGSETSTVDGKRAASLSLFQYGLAVGYVF